MATRHRHCSTRTTARATRPAASLTAAAVLATFAAGAGGAPGDACLANTATAPLLAVDPFDRTRNLNDVYVSAAAAAAAPVGVQKLRLRPDGTIVDRSGNAAVDAASGSLRPGARGFWDAAAAGPAGAGPGAGPASMATVVYGGTRARPTADDAALLVAAHDGRLRALDVVSGAELWSFEPHEREPPAAGGPGAVLAIYRQDLDGDGIIDPAAGDRVYLVLAAGRGAASYYGFDITRKAAPVPLWRVGPEQLPFVGEARAAPSIARVRVAGAPQNPRHLVVILGGGGDAAADSGGRGAGTRGNGIYMLDLVSGALLWRAGPASATNGGDPGADLRLERMTHALAAGVRVLDLTGSGYAGRLYAADTGGRVWRFDVHSGEPAPTLVTGGVFASLGAADGDRAAGAARRFYAAPDVALLHDGGRPFLQLSLGSGSPAAGGRERVRDYFYGLRDYDLGTLPPAAFGRGGFSAARVVTSRSALVDADARPAMSLPPGSPGWRIALSNGERVLAEARTFGGEVFFTTDTRAPGDAGGCARPGTGRLYVVNARDGGRPDNRAATQLTLPPGGAAGPIVFAFPRPDDPAKPNSNAPYACTASGGACRPAPVCLVGLTNCGPLPALAPVRTTWAEERVAD